VTPEVDSTITGLAWLRDGRELALAAYGGVVTFSRNRPEPARKLAYAGSLLDIAASPDGRWLVSGNQDASVHIWRLRDASELEMSGYPSKVTRVGFDRSGRWLVADGGGDPTVWDFSGAGPKGRRPAMLALGDGTPGTARLAWHPEESLLAATTADGLVGLWDPAKLTRGEAVRAQVVLAELAEPVGTLGWLDGAALVATESGRVLLLDR
jgi:WD40 repeat protein